MAADLRVPLMPGVRMPMQPTAARELIRYALAIAAVATAVSLGDACAQFDAAKVQPDPDNVARQFADPDVRFDTPGFAAGRAGLRWGARSSSAATSTPRAARLASRFTRNEMSPNGAHRHMGQRPDRRSGHAVDGGRSPDTAPAKAAHTPYQQRKAP